eukprot:CAMPEP_0196727886 /NCGR_PEP_ID=MMETSP1091-20130531/8757_1 /TAXON_ID=302021 /ORGANISM="Rhodomonas sp., Strain CCMP768" /LENGTH=49 /DNA_ID=CAMNT_0042070567 /DNA_START=32 /DNA_END=181 /DNA_ORIENTATION=-
MVTRRLAMAKTEQHAEKKKHTEHATIAWRTDTPTKMKYRSASRWSPAMK